MSEWFSGWPTKPGYYWFFGKCFQSDTDEKTYLVEVRGVINGAMYVTNGHFIYASEGATGVWAPAELPKPDTPTERRGEP